MIKKNINNNKIIGLTGPSGSGKTEVTKIISKLNPEILIINLDKISHDLLKNNLELKNKIIKNFSNKILDNKNNIINIDRKKLGEIVFSNKQKLDLLNNIIFSYIIKKVFDIISVYKNKIILLDAPTLIQSKLYKICNKIIVVTADKKIRLERIINRDKILLDQAIFRLDNQLPDKEYFKIADFVINNNTNFFELKKNIVIILKKLLEDF
ncbi:MAG: dephospho-CoA kinase [Oscillospiraceae bacterium]|nr:dephospho-CoA kinase [Oscillospiraceae bacterium]